MPYIAKKVRIYRPQIKSGTIFQSKKVPSKGIIHLNEKHETVIFLEDRITGYLKDLDIGEDIFR